MNWKSNTLIFLTYNNYYNRIVKKEETLQDYLEYELFRLSATNFNPADGVNTTHIVNMADGLYPDYIIIVDEYNQIVSRWFIIESDRIRGGQYTLTLHRDLMVDFYDDIVDAPCFIEKATLNAEDPLLFNNEDMSFNQIKTREYPLRDETLSAWVVGYYAKNVDNDDFLKGDIKTNVPASMYDAIIPVPFANWEYNAVTNPIKAGINALDYFINAKRETSRYLAPGKYKYTSSGNYLGFEAEPITSTKLYSLNCPYAGSAQNIAPKIKAQKDTLLEQAKTYLKTETLNESDRAEFLSYNGKIIKDSTGAFYEITIYQESLTYETAAVSAGSLFNSLSNIVTSTDGWKGTPNAESFQVHASFLNYKMTARKLTQLTTSWDIAPKGDTWSPLITEDAPYNIFAIPFDSCKIRTSDTKVYRSDPAYTLPLVESMIRTMTSGQDAILYDIQLLPYCPVNYIGDNLVDARAASAYTLITDPNAVGVEDNVVSFILHVPQTRISRNIQLEYFNIPKPENAIETKIANECNKYRLCSPNFNGYFDFSAAKNGGVDFINVDVTLKPYQPYIHLNPNFGELYGRDFDDPRGLICGGDFSLSQFKDKWQEFQLNNKNYQEMFDRQIQNMEVQNKYQRKQDIWTAVAGTLQGGMTGAATGLMASGGNPYAAAGGAVVGTVASGLTGLADIGINQALRNEAIDYTKDNFGYQLGNIQALPYTLTKVSSFNNNNKIFPLLETYTCTDREKEAFANKLAYNGMTVMAIGKISDYIGSGWTYTIGENEIKDKGYIKGQIIRLPEINEDFHIANEIAKEINLGIYIGGQE